MKVVPALVLLLAAPAFSQSDAVFETEYDVVLTIGENQYRSPLLIKGGPPFTYNYFLGCLFLSRKIMKSIRRLCSGESRRFNSM